MYKVILVDDDELVRVGLEALACFPQKGFEIVDRLSNAKDALDSIRRHKPDVVITDMYMPEFNGIRLIREGRKICPTTIFVVLSCHNNIDFIKEALQAGAYDYLLKSAIVDPKSAEKLLDKLSNACSMRACMTAAKGAAASSKDTVLSYLQGKAPLDAAQKYLYTRGFDIAGRSFFLSGLQFDNYDTLRGMVSSEKELLVKMERYIDDFLAEYGTGFSIYNQNGCFLLLQQVNSGTSAISPYDKLLSICERLRMCVKNNFLHTCSIYVDGQHPLEQLPAAAQTLLLSIASTCSLNFDSVVNITTNNASIYERDQDIESDTPTDPINNVLKYIEKHYASAITLDELAGVANFSKYHLCRKFKEVTHTGIINYILTYRINKAKSLLLDPDSGYIFEIAQAVGFNDASYFNRTFKKITGYTPNEYQRLHKPTH